MKKLLTFIAAIIFILIGSELLKLHLLPAWHRFFGTTIIASSLFMLEYVFDSNKK